MSVYSLKGFVKIKSMINNNPGFISGLGELSTYSQTFSQDIKEYESTIGSLSNYRLHAFYSVDKNSVDVTTPAVYVESVFQCTKIVHDFCASFVGQITKLDIANNLNSMLFGKIDNIVVGDLVTSNGLTMPSSLAWSVIGAEANTLKVWYADQNFSVEYPEYKTLVVPPIDNLDDFFKPVTEIKAALAARSFTRTAELIDEKKNKHPETILRMNEFTLTLANNPEYAPSTVWSTITYGAAGDKSVFNFGIELDKFGGLSIDSKKFNEAVQKDMAGLKDLFLGSAEKKGLGTILKESLDEMTFTGGVLSTYESNMQTRENNLNNMK